MILPPPLRPASPHRQSVTLGVDYRDPVLLSRVEICAKVSKDFAFLGLAAPSAADIERRDEGRLDVTLICVPCELERVDALQCGRDHALNDKKFVCGIKRIWSLSRIIKPQKPHYSKGYKRSRAEIEGGYQLLSDRQKRMRPTEYAASIRALSSSSKLRAGPPASVSSPKGRKSPSEGKNPTTGYIADPPPSPVVEPPEDPTRIPQSREGSPLAKRHTTGPLFESDAAPSSRWGAIKRPPAACESLESVIGPMRSVEIANPVPMPDFALLRIQRLGQTDPSFLQAKSPAEADVQPAFPDLEESRRTQDPRISLSRRDSVASSKSSLCGEAHTGYELGTRLVLVNTDETGACGREARMRRQLERHKRQDAEMRQAVERERDEARERIRKLESELREERLLGGKRVELEAGRGASRSLEARIEDMRQECQRPFVVPALLDAFLKIGEWGDQLVGE